MAKKATSENVTADMATEIMKGGCYLTQTLMLSRVLQSMYGDGLEAHGVTPQQASLLTTIVALDGAHPSDLARELEIERSTMSRNVKVLADRGLVHSERTPTGRTRRIFATEQGAQVVLDFFPAWSGAQHEIEAAIGSERLATFIEVATELRLLTRGVA